MQVRVGLLEAKEAIRKHVPRCKNENRLLRTGAKRGQRIVPTADAKVQAPVPPKSQRSVSSGSWRIEWDPLRLAPQAPIAGYPEAREPRALRHSSTRPSVLG